MNAFVARTAGILAVLACLAPAAVRADLSTYGQDFESMDPGDTGCLGADRWLVYGNVFDPGMNWLYGYGTFPAPNGPQSAFCAIVEGEGGDTQGVRQLSVFSDYENLDHLNGNLVESNLFHEQTVGAGDVGSTWYFEFDGKLGNLEGASKAAGFIKTLDPSAGWALTNFLTVDMTTAPITWDRYSISITIDAGLVGQVLQFGFLNLATNYEGSGVFYDNVVFSTESWLDVTATTRPRALALRAFGTPAVGGAAQVLAFTTPADGRTSVRVYDVAGALVATLADGPLPAGEHRLEWRGRDDAGRAVAPGLYLAEVVAGNARAVAKIQRLR